MSEQAYIGFKTHGVLITRTDDSLIHCFKTAEFKSGPICDYEVFDSEESATEYILKPFPMDRYCIEFRYE